MNELLKDTHLSELYTHRMQDSFFSIQNLCRQDLRVRAVPGGSACLCLASDSARVVLCNNEHLCKIGTAMFPYLEGCLKRVLRDCGNLHFVMVCRLPNTQETLCEG